MDEGMGLEMPFGDGIIDAIGRSDRNLSEMGLKMPSGKEYQKGVHALGHLWTGDLNKR